LNDLLGTDIGHANVARSTVVVGPDDMQGLTATGRDEGRGFWSGGGSAAPSWMRQLATLHNRPDSLPGQGLTALAAKAHRDRATSPETSYLGRVYHQTLGDIYDNAELPIALAATGAALPAVAGPLKTFLSQTAPRWASLTVDPRFQGTFHAINEAPVGQ